MSEEFAFDRRRGIVWVCDVEKSSSLLNDDATANLIEEYLPRLFWLSKQTVEASGGEFIKWTGDGFLAWYKCELHRDRGRVAAKVYSAAWHLSFTNNITQLCIGNDASQKISIRHAVTFEEDALIINIVNKGKMVQKDLIGRNVVAAFRLSNIPVRFPRIVTQGDLVKASATHLGKGIYFEKMELKQDDILKYFKGERIGTRSVYASGQKASSSQLTTSAMIRSIKHTIKRAKGKSDGRDTGFELELVKRLKSGPRWARQVLDEETTFLNKELSLLKTALGALENPENIWTMKVPVMFVLLNPIAV